MNKLGLFSTFIFVFLTATVTATAQEWTQWRGPARDGVVTSKNAPSAWPESLKRTWRVEIGEGYSSPVVSGGRAFVHGCTSWSGSRSCHKKAQKAQKEVMCPLWLDDVGEAFAGAGEPPVAEEEEDEGEDGEVGETTPVGGGAVEKDVAITADQ